MVSQERLKIMELERENEGLKRYIQSLSVNTLEKDMHDVSLRVADEILEINPKSVANIILNMTYGSRNDVSFCEIFGLRASGGCTQHKTCTKCIDAFLEKYYKERDRENVILIQRLYKHGVVLDSDKIYNLDRAKTRSNFAWYPCEEKPLLNTDVIAEVGVGKDNVILYVLAKCIQNSDGYSWISGSMEIRVSRYAYIPKDMKSCINKYVVNKK